MKDSQSTLKAWSL